MILKLNKELKQKDFKNEKNYKISLKTTLKQY